MTSEILTPEMAATLLKANGRRPVSQKTVEKYAAEMARNKWLNTGAPLIFNEDGILQDAEDK
jgi:hypothetical protein